MASTSQPAKQRTTSRHGDADTDQHHTTSRTTQTDDREECENPRHGGHQVFLCHSGHQKSFVEQLFVDLQRENISCFFDKDPQSLPKGEDFPSRIFEATRKCRVGVVVLSDEFISSKWPMQELCALVRAKTSTNPKLKILPLFFGLSPKSLSQKLQKKYCLKRYWQKLPKSSRKLSTNLGEWVNALEALRRINGINYFEEEGEVAYRAQILTSIRRLLPPKPQQEPQYDESYVQGEERLCQAVAELFNNTPWLEDGVKIAGLYGVAGIGKTTLAKIVCNFYSNDFDGRVLHVELEKEMPIQTLKSALRILTDVSETLVNSVTNIEQGWRLFNQNIYGRKVFLAVDNISDLPGSMDEAQRYFRAVRSAGSQGTILLTARSLTILRRFIPEGEGSCMHVPSLKEEEATQVLLQLTPLTVSNLSSAEQDIAKKCALKCYFRWHCTQRDGCNVPFSAYHPLALRAFGALLYERFNSCTDLSRWIDIQNSSKPWRFGHMLEEIFSIFEESFLRLREDYRNIFMLLCLYLPEPNMISEEAFNWLALACDIEVEDIKFAIVELKRKGFVESIMKSGHRLCIHDLHIKFAENKADGRGKWISLKERCDIPTTMQEEASSTDRPRFLAMKFVNCHFQCPGFVNYELLRNVPGFVNYELLRNVLVLHLQDMPQLKILDLSPMRIVRSITIVGCGGMQEIRGLENLTSLAYFLVKGCSANVQLLGMERLVALQHLQVDANLRETTTESLPLSWMSFPPLQSASVVGTIHLDHIEKGTRLVDLSACSKLRTIKLSQCDIVQIDLTGCLELREIEIVYCKNLSEIYFFSPNLAGLETRAFCSTLKSRSLPRPGPAFSNLSHLRLVGLRKLEKLPDLIGLTGVSILELKRMDNLKELPSVTGLTRLQRLHLDEMPSLKELPSLTGLTGLQHLHLDGMHSLKELPSLTGLTKLWYLRLDGMHSLKELPSLTGLTGLKDLRLDGMHSLKELPSLTGLTRLWHLQLDGMHSLKELPSLAGLTGLGGLVLKAMHNLKELPSLTGLTRLQYIRLIGMRSLKELPSLTGLTELSFLYLEGTHSLKELPSLTGLTELSFLYLEGIHSLKELPSFTGLTGFRDLHWDGMQSLKELPSLIGLTRLNYLRLGGMHSLKKFPSFTGLSELSDLYLDGMHSLKELPSLVGLTRLKCLWLNRMHSLKELPTLTGLTWLEVLYLEGMHSLKELPSFTGLTGLKSLHLGGMHSLKELPTLTGSTWLNNIWLEGMHSLKEFPNLTGLTELKVLHLEGMHSLKELSTLTGLTTLEVLRLSNMHSLKKLPNLTDLTALDILWLGDMHSSVQLPTLTGFNTCANIYGKWYFKSLDRMERTLENVVEFHRNRER